MSITDLQIEVKGQKKIITKDWLEQIQNSKAIVEAFKIGIIENDDQYKEAFKFSSNIKKGQEYIIEVINSLDDREILKAKEKLLELKKIMAGKKTAATKAIDNYKIKQKDDIIENGFANIKEFKNFKADFNVYTKECLLGFKGLSDFTKMNDISMKIAEDYEGKLELNQLKFKNNFNSLKLFCIEIGLVKTDNELIDSTNKIVLNGKDIESIKLEYKNIKKLQDEKIEKEKLKTEEQAKQQKLQDEKIEKEKLKTEEQAKQPEIKKTDVNSFGLGEFVTIKNVASVDDNKKKEKNDLRRFLQISSHINKYEFETAEAKNILQQLNDVLYAMIQDEIGVV